MSKLSLYPVVTIPPTTLRLLGTDPANPAEAPTGTTETIPVADLFPGVVWPSGSAYGVKDPANVAAAIASDGAATLMPGTYYGDSAVSYSLGQVVQSLAGWKVTRWNNVGSTPAFTISNPGAYGGDVSASLTGLQIDGSGASAGASAIQAGDIVGIDIDAWVSNWTGGAIAAKLLNAVNWTERAKVKLKISNCDTGLKLDQSGTGTNSFDRTEIELDLTQGADQNGIVFGGTTAGALLLEGVLRMHGNFGGSGTPVTAAAISFITENAGITSGRIEIGMETGDGGYNPQTIAFLDGSTNIFDCVGGIEFFQGSSSFAPSNNAHNLINFGGKVNGDPSLVTGDMTGSSNAASGTQAITSASPAAVTAISAPVAAYTTYEIRAWVPYSSAVAAGTPKFAFTGPAQVNTQLRYEFWSATGLVSAAAVTDFTTAVTGPTLTSSASLLVKIEGTVECSNYGNVALTAWEGTSGDSFTILAGAKITSGEMQN